MRYATVERLSNSYPVQVLCEALSVSGSGYNQWRRRVPCEGQRANAQLLEHIRIIHARSRGIYGSPRIYHELKKQGICVGKERVRRLMRAHLIVGRYCKRYCRTTDSAHARPLVPNRLQQNFACAQPNTVWLADITHVATAEGFLFVAAMKDLCTRKIVGWSMSPLLDAQLALNALSMAVKRQRPGLGVLVHSDRGSQYASHAFQAKLAQLGMLQSMSGKGNCYDNAPMESFFASLKIEQLDRQRFLSRDQARAAVFDYIETFYNPVRLHSAIGYAAPNEYEAKLQGV